MTQIDFERGLLVMAAWRLASTDDPNELVAIACVLRNTVMGRVPALRFHTYGDAVNHFLQCYPLRPIPHGSEAQLVDPQEGLLARIDGVYDNSMPDITSSREHPNGAGSFCVARRDPVFARGRVLIGTFGGQQFYE